MEEGYGTNLAQPETFTSVCGMLLDFNNRHRKLPLMTPNPCAREQPGLTSLTVARKADPTWLAELLWHIYFFMLTELWRTFESEMAQKQRPGSM